MSNVDNPFLAKSEWGPGPWQDEPDREPNDRQSKGGMKHLWDVKHSYMCDAREGYTAEHVKFRSFGEYASAWGEIDIDYNLLFRWDWDQEPDENVGELTLCFMQQRHGRFVSVSMPVCAADEPAVRAFLKPFWEHLRALWLPISEYEVT